MPTAETIFALVAATAITAFILGARDHLLVSLVSSEVAIASGIAVGLLQLSFMIAFAVTVALGMRYLGVLLMGSLIIIPATVVKRGQPVLMECSRFQSELRLPPHFSVFGSLL